MVAAAVVSDGKVLATQRGYGEWKGWWEFPGGKVEAGESMEEALRRELREELSLGVEVGECLATVDYDYASFHLTMHLYRCTPLGTMALHEHSDARWLDSRSLTSVEWLPADRGVLPKVEAIIL